MRAVGRSRPARVLSSEGADMVMALCFFFSWFLSEMNGVR